MNTTTLRTTISQFDSALPPFALIALEALEKAGFEAWLVGGFVRDTLLDLTCADIDIATRATGQEASHIFRTAGFSVYESGIKHGTITVIIDDHAIEVTTYRTDGVYRNHRHPQNVSFVRSIEEDLARRDFTINALAYHPQRGLLDPYHGISDIEEGIIRTVGDPHERFSEDALRILRACRFSSQLGFRIEERTFQALMEQKNLLPSLSSERITHELEKLLCGAYVHDALMETVDVLSMVLPELVAAKNFDQQTPYHIYDVLEHTAWVVQYTPATPLTRWAALFHDLGKPASFFVDQKGTGHFYGHAKISLALAAGIMDRLAFSSIQHARILALVKHHDDVIEPTPRHCKRFLARLQGDTDLFRALCALKRADAQAQAPQYAKRAQEVDCLERILDDIIASQEAFTLSKLAIKGGDVLACGVKAGPAVGEILNAALDAVIDEQKGNDPDELRAFVREWIKQHDLS